MSNSLEISQRSNLAKYLLDLAAKSCPRIQLPDSLAQVVNENTSGLRFNDFPELESLLSSGITTAGALDQLMNLIDQALERLEGDYPMLAALTRIKLRTYSAAGDNLMDLADQIDDLEGLLELDMVERDGVKKALKQILLPLLQDEDARAIVLPVLAIVSILLADKALSYVSPAEITLLVIAFIAGAATRAGVSKLIGSPDDEFVELNQDIRKFNRLLRRVAHDIDEQTLEDLLTLRLVLETEGRELTDVNSLTSRPKAELAELANRAIADQEVDRGLPRSRVLGAIAASQGRTKTPQ